MKTIWKATMYAAILAALHFSLAGMQQTQMSSAQNVAAARAIGTVQSITGTIFTMKTDQGVSYTVTVPSDAKVLRLEPGQTSLSGATPLDFSNVQIGDRVLASGNPGNGPNTIMASTIVAIKKTDVAAKQQQDLQDWTRRGTGGLVASVDPASGTVLLKVSAAAGTTKNVTVHIAKTTQILRYAPDSVKFDDAKPSTLDAIKPGDQLLARGTKSEDGSDVTAEAIVSGNFRNLSGIISSVNPAENILVLKDAATKTNFTVKITPDTQLRKLPTQAANMLAARMKAGAGGASGGEQAGGGRGGNGGYGGRAGGRGFGGGGGGDLSQVIARAPTVTLADLQKGDAVMIVSTSGQGSGQVSAIQLVAGVEPILEASPNAGMSLPAWDVGGGGGGGDE